MAKPKQNPPHGMEKYDLGGVEDLGALSEEQQQTLNEFKVTKYWHIYIYIFILRI